MNEINGRLDGAGMRFGVVAARFNGLVVERLVEGAADALSRHGVADDAIDLVRVPGAFEIPLVAGQMARSGRYDAVLCLGTIIRGATPHFEYVASECAKGVARAGMETGVPVIFGVLTTESIEQAIERAGTKAGNKGADAAVAAIETVDVLRRVAAVGA